MPQSILASFDDKIVLTYKETLILSLKVFILTIPGDFNHEIFFGKFIDYSKRLRITFKR